MTDEGAALQPDGKILLGADSGAAGLHFLVVRLNADGSLDTTFANGQGYVGRSSGNCAGSGSGIILDAAGNILLYGYDTDPATNSTAGAVVRYTSAGLPDATFGSSGETFPDPTTTSAVLGGAVDPSGRVLVSLVHPASTNTNYYCELARLNTDGSIDTTFGTTGFFTDAVMLYPDAIAVQPDGKILLAGHGPNGASTQGYLLDRTSATGQIDPTFGVNGQAQAYFAGMTGGGAGAIALGPDGKITVTGSVYFYNPPGSGWNYDRFGTARFLNDITSNTTSATATASSTMAMTASAPLSTAPAALANSPFSPGLAPLILDSLDLSDALHPLSKRRGNQ
jgi:uncharacterized delta-60 repeat protein